MGVYDHQTANFLRVCKAKGQAVTFRQIVPGAPADPSQPWKPTTGTVTDTAANVVFIPFQSRRLYEWQYADKDEVPKISLIGYMGYSGVQPRLKDVIMRAGTQLNIAGFSEYSPNGEIIGYVLGLAG